MKSNHGLAEAALMARWYFLAGPGRDVGIDMRAEENAAHEHGQSAKRKRKAA